MVLCSVGIANLNDERRHPFVLAPCVEKSETMVGDLLRLERRGDVFSFTPRNCFHLASDSYRYLVANADLKFARDELNLIRHCNNCCSICEFVSSGFGF